MRPFGSLSRLVGLCSLVVMAAGLAEDTCAQTFTFNSDQLLVVASASPNSSFLGGDGNTSLSIDQDTNDYGGPGMSHGLLRFLDFQAPAEAVVRSAQLKFFTSDATDGPVDVYRMTVDWTTSTTWGSLGGDGLTPGVETLSAVGGSQADILEGFDLSFDVTSIVTDWLRGAPNHGFGIISQSGDGWDFPTIDSSDGLQLAPRLIVEFTSPPPLRLQVDPASGYARFVTDLGSSVAAVTLTSVEFVTTGAPFDVASWELSNLSAQGLDAIDPASEGMRWEVVGGAPNQLIESYFLGGSNLVDGETLPVGKLFANGVGETAMRVNYIVDVDYADPATTDLRDVLYVEDVIVEFLSLPVTGDYNSDGLVDAADYSVWRDQLGATGPGLTADGDSSGAVNQQDYQLWQANYGSGGATAATTVPEPLAWAMLLAPLSQVLNRRTLR